MQFSWQFKSSFSASNNPSSFFLKLSFCLMLLVFTVSNHLPVIVIVFDLPAQHFKYGSKIHHTSFFFMLCKINEKNQCIYFFHASYHGSEGGAIPIFKSSHLFLILFSQNFVITLGKQHFFENFAVRTSLILVWVSRILCKLQ